MPYEPEDFLRDVISSWEGGYQSYADDMGNWVDAPNGTRVKIGTMRGVTPATLAAHRGVPAWTLTPEDMQAVTLDEAVAIGMKHYYHDVGLDRLVWGPATAAILDFGWVAGPHQAILSTQRLIGVGADGVIGPLTAAAYDHWCDANSWWGATRKVHDMRDSFYRYLVSIRPANAQYLQGWLNRDNWASQSNVEWYKRWTPEIH